uniref:MATH domain-containing protein n=1 Tax=Setaria viridis TaxID=4556 RepID=A0A4U6UT37_SETVI|nr:hypothetical protein SEVIR_4G035600v2 [Setaria viridis]
MSAEPAFTTSAIVASIASPSHVLKINGYSRTKGLTVGVHLRSHSFDVYDHSWHLAYLPNGDCAERSDYISIYLVLDGTANGGLVLAQFSINLLDCAGRLASTYTRTSTTNQEVLDKSRHLNLKYDSFYMRHDITVVTKFHVEDTATITVQATAVPVFVAVSPPNLSRRLGHLLLNEQGADGASTSMTRTSQCTGACSRLCLVGPLDQALLQACAKDRLGRLGRGLTGGGLPGRVAGLGGNPQATTHPRAALGPPAAT